MTEKVYDGIAELDIRPFLKGLTQLETAIEATEQKIVAAFTNIETNLDRQIGSIKSKVQALGQELKQAIPVIQVQAQQQTVKKQNAIVPKTDNSTQLNYLKAQFAEARNLIDQESERTTQATKQYLQTVVRDLNIAERTVALARVSGVKGIKKLTDDYKAQLESAEQELKSRIAKLETAIAEQRNKVASSLSNQRIFAGKAKLAADTPTLEAAKAGYEQEVRIATEAKAKEAALEKELTAVYSAQRAIQTKLVKQAADAQVQAANDAENKGIGGFIKRFSKDFSEATNNLKKVEDRFNSIFRAGSQLASFGQTLSFLSAGIGAFGAVLTGSAAKFDFWIRRTVAANVAADGTKTSLIEFGNVVKTVGQDIGIFDNEQIVKGLFDYQAALGTAINTSEDLQRVTQNLDIILRAAAITNTDSSVAIKGVSQIMSEYGFTLDQLSYVTSVLTNVTSVSQAEFTDVIETFAYLGPTAGRLGIGLDQMAAVFARLADAGFKGSVSGRAIGMAFADLLDPTKKASEELQKILVTNQGLSGSWQSLVAPNGRFINLLDTTTESGQKQVGLLHLLAQATKGFTAVQREAAFAKIFDSNATKEISTLVGEYSDKIKGVSGAAQEGKQDLQALYAEFSDPNGQLTNFQKQWEIVGNSIENRLGRAKNTITSALETIGTKVAETAVPIVETVAVIVTKISEWAEKNPELADTIIKVAGALALLFGVLGPGLYFLGISLQGLATIPIVLASVSTGFTFLAKQILSFGQLIIGAFTAFSPLTLFFIALLGLLVGTGDGFSNLVGKTGEFVNSLKSLLTDLLQFVIGVFQLLYGLFSGDDSAIQEALQRLYNGFAGFFADLASSFVVWGENLMISLGQGFIDAIGFVVNAALDVINSFIGLFESHSPPVKGPLKNITKWGTALINSYIDGFTSADFAAIEDVGKNIEAALKANIDQGGLAESLAGEANTAINNLLVALQNEIKAGRQVNAEFFEPLRQYLGDWYKNISQILLAYQKVQLLQSQIGADQKRLELLSAQREQLKAQLDLRNSIFESYRNEDGLTDDEESAIKVDPTTEAGKAKIEQLRALLSPEEFDNWINLQEKLWQTQFDSQDRVLKAQVDALNVRINAEKLQLDVLKEQYDTAVALFDFLRKGIQDTTKSSGSRGGGSSRPSGAASEADLEEARRRVRAVSGQDVGLQSEDQIAGDSFGKISEAQKQRDRERQRIADLETENRRRKAEFDVQKIQANGDKKRLAEIAAQEKAWDAAYQEEKARVKEREQFAQDVLDKTKEQAEVSSGGRIAEQEVKFAEDIKKITGDNVEQIKDEKQLREESKSITEADNKAHKQTQVEEKKLQDLRRVGDEKRLEFKKRLDDAKGDEAQIARIKEEQEAWERAFDAAELEQQRRIDAAKEVERILDEAAQKAKKQKEGAGSFPGGSDLKLPQIPPLDAKKLFGDLTIPDGFKGALADIKNFAKDIIDIKPPKALEDFNKGVQLAEGVWEDAKRGWENLKNGNVSLSELGDATLTFFSRFGQTGKGIFDDFLIKVGLVSDTAKTNTSAAFTAIKTAGELVSTGLNLAFGKDTFVANITGNADIVRARISGLFDPQEVTSAVGLAIQGLGLIRDGFGEFFNPKTGTPLIVAGGLDTIKAHLSGTFDPEKGSAVAAIKLGLDTAVRLFGAALNPEDKNTIPSIIGTSLDSIRGYVSKTFSPEATEGIVQIANTGLSALTALTSKSFDPASATSIVSIINKAVSNLVTQLGILFGGAEEAARRAGRAAREAAGGGTGDTRPGGDGADGNHAFGLYSVPFDNYLARLHKGEKVLTAAQAKAFDRILGSGIFDLFGTLKVKLGNIPSAIDTVVSRPSVVNNSRTINDNRISRTLQTGAIYVSTHSDESAFIHKLANLL